MNFPKLLIVGALLVLTPFNFHAQDKKVALTTFWVSKHIGFEQLGGGVGMVAAISSLMEDPNFNLQPVLDNFYTTFTEEYAEQFPFALLPTDSVIGKKEYQEYE